MKLTGQQSRCTACGELFARVSTFDKHRFSTDAVKRSCRDQQWMLGRGWFQDSRGFWKTAKGNFDRH